jgi:hypothetical protein
VTAERTSEVTIIQRHLEAPETIERGPRVTMAEFFENRAGSTDRMLRLRGQRAQDPGRQGRSR